MVVLTDCFKKICQKFTGPGWKQVELDAGGIAPDAPKVDAPEQPEEQPQAEQKTLEAEKPRRPYRTRAVEAEERKSED